MRRWTNAFLVLGAVLVAVLLAEAIARAAFPHWAPRTGRITRFWRYDRNLGWSHVPGTKGQFSSFGFDATVQINGAGFRGPEIPDPKPGNRTRILILGDSYVWGFGVGQDEIMSVQLASRCPEIEAINLAVSGYSTDQELLLFRERGHDLEPDVVILVVAANDFESNLRTREYIYYQKPRFVIADGKLVLTNRPVPPPGWLLRTAASLAQRSYLVTQTNRVAEGVLRRVTEGARGSTSAASPSRSKSPRRPFPRGEAERVTAALIDELGRSVEEVGARFALVFADRQGRRGRDLASFLGHSDWLVLHLDDFLPQEAHGELHLEGDFHWSPAGHAKVAEVLARELVAARFVPSGSCVPVMSEIDSQSSSHSDLGESFGPTHGLREPVGPVR